jgi:zinc protease
MSIRRLVSTLSPMFLLAATLQAATAVSAQTVTSAAPASPRIARAAGAADTATSEFSVNGLRVILRRNTATDVVAANLYLLGGTQQLTQATQGIETFLLAASERGTKRYPKARLRQKTAQLGSQITIDPDEDWTLFGMLAIRTAFDSTWALFADRVMSPTLDSTEVELLRAQIVGALQQGRTHPDEELELLADSLRFERHPYGLTPRGTAASVASLTLAQLRDYHDKQFVTSRMLLVVVGNVDRARLEALVRGTLATLPRGNYAWTAPSAPAESGRAAAIEQRALPTNYIMGYYVGPRAGTRDYEAIRIATAVLSGRFFSEIRSRRNLTYAVDAPFVERALSSGGVYVTTVAPDLTLAIMRRELDRLQTELIDPDGLKRLVQQFITDYFLKNETNADQATFLARAALYEGDYRAAYGFVDELRQVTPEDVRRVANQYMHDFRFVYLGDASRAPRDLMAKF